MADVGPPNTRLNELKLRWEQDPSSRLFLQLADEYRKLGQAAEAVAVLEEGLQHRPRDLSALVALGRCRLELEEIEPAAELLEGVISRDPTHIVANKLLLDAYLQMGDAGRAGERLETYRLLNSRDPEIDHLEYRLERLRSVDQREADTVVASDVSEEALAPADDPEIEMASAPVLDMELVEDEPQPESSAFIADAAPAPVAEDSEGLRTDPFGRSRSELPALDLGALWSQPPRTKLPSGDPFSGLIQLEASQHWRAIAEEGLFVDPGIETVVTPTVATDSGGQAGIHSDHEASSSEPSESYEEIASETTVASKEAALDVPTEPSDEPADSNVAGLVAGVAAAAGIMATAAFGESTKATQADSVVESVEEARVEAIEESRVQAMEESPVETMEEPPVEAIEESPVEVVEEPPVEAIEEVGVEAFEEAQIDVAEEVEVYEETTAEVVSVDPEPDESSDLDAMLAETAGLGTEQEQLQDEESDLDALLAQAAAAADAPDPEALAEAGEELTSALEVEALVPSLEVADQAVDTGSALSETFGTDTSEPFPEPKVERAPVIEEPQVASHSKGIPEEANTASATLGQLYLKQGHHEEAERIFRQVLMNEPANAAAIAGLDQISGRRTRALTAADLLAVRTTSGKVPEGLTAKKVLVLGNYLKHLRMGDDVR